VNVPPSQSWSPLATSSLSVIDIIGRYRKPWQTQFLRTITENHIHWRRLVDINGQWIMSVELWDQRWRPLPETTDVSLYILKSKTHWIQKFEISCLHIDPLQSTSKSAHISCLSPEDEYWCRNIFIRRHFKRPYHTAYCTGNGTLSVQSVYWLVQLNRCLTDSSLLEFSC